jgi:hypothetical protein
MGTVQNGPDEFSQKEIEFKIFDFQYYEEELDIFEWFFMGDLTFGEFKVRREFVDTEDRLSKINHGEKQFTYMTRMESTKFKESEKIATIAMIHGFSECSSTSFFETAMMHAMNGFEVILIDYKGFGYASGPRGGGFVC